MCPETRDLAGISERPETNMRLRVELEANGDTVGLLSALSEVYRNFYSWDVIVSQAELDSLENGHSREMPIKRLSSYAASIPPEHELRSEKLRATPPVLIEITGAAEPLKRLQWYFAKRRVDWNRQTKEPSEDRRLELEEQRIDAVREQVDLLHGLGFPESQIREALSEYVFGPLDRLERYTGIKVSSAEEIQSTANPVVSPKDSDEG
jgi:hypothetical protein